MYAHDPALVELEYFENFGAFAFSTILFFRHSFGGRDRLKKSRILEEFAHHDVEIQFGHMMQGGIVYIYMHIYTNIYRYGLASVNTNVFTSTCQQTCMHQICLRIWIIFMHSSLLAHNGMQVRLSLSGFVYF